MIQMLAITPAINNGDSQMAKHYKWEGNKLTFSIPGAGDASIDIASLPEAVKQAALMFGVQTAARNATAGFFGKEPATALKRMSARFKNWLEGTWKAASTGGEGESKTSMLAQAFAEAATAAGTPMDAEGAAELISGVIEEKVAEADLSADEDDDKPAIRKIASAVRASFAEMPEVAPILTRIKAEAAQRRAAEAVEAAAKAKAEGKVGGLAEVLGQRK
jgi:hypothetical protein